MSPGRSAERERCLVPSKQCLTEAIRDEAVPAPFLNPPWPDPKLLESGLRAIPHVVKSRLGSKKGSTMNEERITPYMRVWTIIQPL